MSKWCCECHAPNHNNIEIISTDAEQGEVPMAASTSSLRPWRQTSSSCIVQIERFTLQQEWTEPKEGIGADSNSIVELEKARESSNAAAKDTRKSFWLLAKLHRQPLWLAALAAVVAAILRVLDVSGAWWLVLAFWPVLSSQGSLVLPRRLKLLALLSWALATGLLAVSYCLLLVRAPSGHAASEMLASAALSLLALLFLEKFETFGAASCKPCSRCCGICLTALFPICVFFIIFTILDAVWSFYMLLEFGPDSFAYTDEGVRLNYWCSGSVTGGAIVLIEAGYMQPAPALDFYVQGFAATTRTCAYDVAGSGWSSEQSRYGFRDDARNMKAVLDAEFEKAGLEAPSSNKIAVVAGHSRGFLSASTFKMLYNDSYSRVLVLGLDGSSCNAYTFEGSLGAGRIVASLAFSLPILTGLMRTVLLLSPSLRTMALSAGEDQVDEIHASDVEVEWEFFERMLGLPGYGHWRSMGARAVAWVDNYDGPDDYTCGSQRSDTLHIYAGDLCVQGKCALHTSSVMSSKFADIVVTRVSSWLVSALAEGNSTPDKS
eukprot:TRINITY_DN68142_c0_g1_i1.p1 TRINITY_DN68142_c0_g1~~TRINITY_DN68142_c0_g1_i1.p1  ORF type:complete len:547 (+),score=101.27 TRINITY_DN68142_c0_g1_i1:153-1793(+)